MTRPTDVHPTATTPLSAAEVEDHGDPACWAHRACQQCGRLNDLERPTVCEACGATFPRD